MAGTIRRVFPKDQAEAERWRSADERIRLATMEGARHAAGEPLAMVCGSNSYFEDDQFGECVECGSTVVHRPWRPARSVLVCLDCFVLAEGVSSDDPRGH